MKHKAVILRVNRNAAGSRFPFDKVYFFKKESCAQLHKIFRFALVIPSTKCFVHMLKDTVKAYPCEVGKVYPMKRRDEESTLRMISEELPINDVVHNYKNYVGLVPILFSRNDKVAGNIVPSYMHASLKTPPNTGYRSRVARSKISSYELANRNMQSMIRDSVKSDAYFIADGEEYQPVCSICPNSLANIVGDCQLGVPLCFDKLSRVSQTNFRKNMYRYSQWLEKTGEPELKLEIGDE